MSTVAGVFSSVARCRGVLAGSMCAFSGFVSPYDLACTDDKGIASVATEFREPQRIIEDEISRIYQKMQ